MSDIRRFRMTATIEFDMTWPGDDDGILTEEELEEAYDHLDDMGLQVRLQLEAALKEVGVDSFEITTPDAL